MVVSWATRGRENGEERVDVSPIKKLESSHVTKISFWNQESTYKLTEIARWLLHKYLDTSVFRSGFFSQSRKFDSLLMYKFF